MQAALAAGFDAVVPVSLGDELVAGEILRLAQLRARRPVVQCACPFALAQLCKREANLADVTIAVAPAPVALARALRLERHEVQHITYVGGCPGAQDPDIDLQIQPAAFLRGLSQKGIAIIAQPDVFTDRLPPDRRRFLSMPGGAPRTDLVATLLRRNVVELNRQASPLLAVADAMFDGGATMIDPASAYRCLCAGSEHAPSAADGRLAITALEPSRSSTPIFDAPAWLDLRPTVTAGTTHAAELTPTADVAYSAPASFADAVRITAGALTSRAPVPSRAVPADSAPTTHSSADDVRRRHALGVRTARRRSAATAENTAPTPPASADLAPTSGTTLHAQPIEREVPLNEAHDPISDRLGETVTPPPRRPAWVDDLFRRD